MKVIKDKQAALQVPLIDGSYVSVPPIILEYEGDERERMISRFKDFWKGVGGLNSNKTGILRGDGIVTFDRTQATHKDSIGLMNLAGFYELNGRSPEESAFFAEVAERSDYGINVLSYLVKCIIDTFGNEIIFVSGSNLIKDSWAPSLCKQMRKFEIAVWEMTYVELMRLGNPQNIPVWIWGDIAEDGECHFPKHFITWLKKQLFPVFNSLGEEYLFDKSNIPCGYAEKISGWGLIKTLLCREDFVMKPNKGASGNGITFRSKQSFFQWLKGLLCLRINNCAVWRGQFLEKVIIDGVEYAIDVNPVFWANKGSIEYLYTVSRIEGYASYWARKTLNVSKGANVVRGYR